MNKLAIAKFTAHAYRTMHAKTKRPRDKNWRKYEMKTAPKDPNRWDRAATNKIRGKVAWLKGRDKINKLSLALRRRARDKAEKESFKAERRGDFARGGTKRAQSRLFDPDFNPYGFTRKERLGNIRISRMR